MVYEWRTGSCIKADPQKSGEMFERLAQTEAGLTAETLLDANRPKGTPLHEDYEWNNDSAAEKWRLHQSRHFLNSLTVCVFSDMSNKEVQTRAVHITTDAHKYEPISLIVQQKDKYAQLLENAKAELASFRRKYEILTELSSVFELIDKINK